MFQLPLWLFVAHLILLLAILLALVVLVLRRKGQGRTRVVLLLAFFVLAPALFIAIAKLQASGFCIKSMSFITSSERLSLVYKAIVDGKFEPPKERSAYIPYDSIEQFKDQNAGCCALLSDGAIDDGVRPGDSDMNGSPIEVTFGSELVGFPIDFAFGSYTVRQKDSGHPGGVRVVERSARGIAISSCGYVGTIVD